MSDKAWLDLPHESVPLNQLYCLPDYDPNLWLFFKTKPVTRIHVVENNKYTLPCVSVLDLHLNEGGLHAGWGFRVDGEVRSSPYFLQVNKPSMALELKSLIKEKRGQTNLQYMVGPLRIFTLHKSTLIAVDQATIVTQRLDNQE